MEKTTMDNIKIKAIIIAPGCANEGDILIVVTNTITEKVAMVTVTGEILDVGE